MVKRAGVAGITGWSGTSVEQSVTKRAHTIHHQLGSTVSKRPGIQKSSSFWREFAKTCAG
jgi:hypothetical protein